ncbi:NTF2-like protein [Gracilaria domingensis]|nr:NTF2-like protein [Gracilaria domingensis]
MSVAFLTSVPLHCRLNSPLSATFRSSRHAPKPLARVPSTRAATVRCCVEQPAWKRGPIDADFAKDEQLQILEEDLDDALLVENYKRASVIRDKLVRLQSGAYVAVLSAHMKFYKAFSSGSIVDIASCWLQSPDSTCKHPSGPVMTGYLNVLNSFGYIFSMGIPKIDVKNVCITMRGTVAYVTCEEHSTDWETEDGRPHTVVMNAINMFTKRNGEWYICHHSALPVTEFKG